MNPQNNNLGNILLADDEQTFLSATAQLLRNEGFKCDCSENAEQALEKLSQQVYDVLITDIKMPGNINLELVKKVTSGHPTVRIILVTGYPSQKTAIEAIRLPVTAYLIKPLDFAELRQKTMLSAQTSMLCKAVSRTKNNLTKWTYDLENIEMSLGHDKYNTFDTALNSFLSITIAELDETFDSIQTITGLLGNIEPQTKICNVMKCPRLSDLTDGLQKAIDSIKKSREAYKSKQLAQIRVKLEKLLENILKV